MVLDDEDIKFASDEQLLRLLAFALKHSSSGERLSKTPPKTRRDIINQLHWLGVLT